MENQRKKMKSYKWTRIKFTPTMILT